MNEIRLALLGLTSLHQRVLRASDLFSQMFAAMNQNQNPPPTWAELDIQVKALEQQVPGFAVWFEPRHQCSVLVPLRPEE